VDHLAVKCFWTFAWRKRWHVGYATEPPNAENNKICRVCLQKNFN
jgi:hypothetical protein